MANGQEGSVMLTNAWIPQQDLVFGQQLYNRMLYIGIYQMYILRLGFTGIQKCLALRYYCGLEKCSLEKN